MFSNKIRTAFAVLAAASSVAVAATPASAAPNIPNRFTRSAEGLRLIRQQQFCSSLFTSYVNYQALRNFDFQNGDDKNVAIDDKELDQIKQNGKAAGCSWA